jgi:hypothetical protein
VHRAPGPCTDGEKGGSEGLVELGGVAVALRGGAGVLEGRARRAARQRGRDATGACQQPRGEVTRRLGVAVQRRWVKGGRRGRVSEALWGRARPDDMLSATETEWWSGRRGRGRADVVTGHWGLPRG